MLEEAWHVKLCMAFQLISWHFCNHGSMRKQPHSGWRVCTCVSVHPLYLVDFLYSVAVEAQCMLSSWLHDIHLVYFYEFMFAASSGRLERQNAKPFQ